MNLHSAADRLGFHGTVSRIDLQVRVFGHAYFNSRTTPVVSPGEAPVAHYACVELNAIAVLAAVDVHVLVQLVALINDAKFDLLRVARGDPHGAVIGINPDLRATRNRIRLRPFFRPSAATQSQSGYHPAPASAHSNVVTLRA